VDPDLTNSKCSYWHFRFDADTSMKMEAMTTFIKDQPDVKKVYLLNQNYAHGHQVAKYAKEMLARKRPDVQIVGEDLHPLAQVRDFAPYIAKIKASGADSVITGNWGSDLSLLFKAANEAGLQRQVLHLLHRRLRHADGAGPTVPAASTRWPTATTTWVAKAVDGRRVQAKFNDDFYTAPA
jgi:branched-chain amino acid transport system substrate-binding protein